MNQNTARTGLRNRILNKYTPNSRVCTINPIATNKFLVPFETINSLKGFTCTYTNKEGALAYACSSGRVVAVARRSVLALHASFMLGACGSLDSTSMRNFTMEWELRQRREEEPDAYAMERCGTGMGRLLLFEYWTTSQTKRMSSLRLHPCPTPLNVLSVSCVSVSCVGRRRRSEDGWAIMSATHFQW